MKGQPFIKRLGFALHGLHLAFRREASLRLQFLAATGALVGLIVTAAPPVWWAIGILVIGLVLVAELVNSALETLSDLLHPAHHPEIRAVKDIAAGAVLVASVIALAVALAFCLS
ncbi:diacylglycerol kinase [Noviherbaspirillum denitrificans]|uniref:Diacylglycerol kinase n=1 Tax=Noviherbaspirillum denitrificans TaxID=1968433 RepID=A0A254TBW1_9BURK|nr:diacylglycerol kinase [Noviherbaspirillum denitrificans]OWW20131.1 diacylglycerol kinase [Noviherbaspirillum denitrificans]